MAHLDHISVQTWIDGSDPPSQMFLFLDQLLGVILLRWIHSTCLPVLHSVKGKGCLGTGSSKIFALRSSKV